jgi:raffinose/stachyose/melibiose transport system substrate-binding protein
MRSFGAVAATLVLAGTFYASGPASASAKTTLVLWQNYGTEQNAVATRNLIAAFEKLNPNITIKDVAQPGTSYFTLLQSAAISGNGPDLAVMWTGIYDLQYSSYLVNLKGNVPPRTWRRWRACSGRPRTSTSLGAYVMPLETQFYIGFYNKALFKEAGITTVPTDWSQLFADCKALKAKGIQPLVYGNGGQAISTEFYPWYDMSYLMIGAHSLASWKDLYDGSLIPWTSSTNVAQLKMWATFEKDGYTNSDVLTNTSNIQQFEKGKAAMMVDGTWDTAQYTKTMGTNVAAFVPPYSNTPIKGVVEYPGDGFSVTKYSKNKKDAFKFLDFLSTTQAGNIINAAGLIPDISGLKTTNPVNQEMLNFVTVDHMTPYPMMDNYVQVNVGNAADSELPSVLGEPDGAD